MGSRDNVIDTGRGAGGVGELAERDGASVDPVCDDPQTVREPQTVAVPLRVHDDPVIEYEVPEGMKWAVEAMVRASSSAPPAAPRSSSPPASSASHVSDSASSARSSSPARATSSASQPPGSAAQANASSRGPESSERDSGRRSSVAPGLPDGSDSKHGGSTGPKGTQSRSSNPPSSQGVVGRQPDSVFDGGTESSRSGGVDMDKVTDSDLDGGLLDGEGVGAQSAVADLVFDSALQDAIAAPFRMDLWDRVEGMAHRDDRAVVVAAAYRSVLDRDHDRGLDLELIDRALRFHDEWVDDADGVTALLDRVLDVDPSARWAFDRMSLKLTVEARWDALLELYDKVIASTEDLEARLALLDEAAAVAKDCAGNPKRAVDYLQHVFWARPTDHRAASALERLLKQQKRYRDLIEFWTSRLTVLSGQEALSTMQQIATCWLEDLHDPNGALVAVEPLALDSRMAAVAASLLDRIVGSAASTMAVRMRALELLGKAHDGTSRWRTVVRALDAALAQVAEADQPVIHREIARRLVEHEAHVEALGHLAALVAAEPDVWTQDVLAKVLLGVLDEQVDGFRPVLGQDQGRQLVHMAAERVGTTQARSIELYRTLIAHIPADRKAISSLGELYMAGGFKSELLSLREHELGLATDPEHRLVLRMQIASLYVSVRDVGAAVLTLRSNLREQADHEPTIDEIIRLLGEQGRYRELAELLTEQASAVDILGCDELAVRLWMQAARVHKGRLDSLDDAVECYKRAVELQPSVEALDELANACLGREQYASAVSWLRRLYEITRDADRTPTAVRLARAYIGAGETKDAL
ncbi:MAG: hypothetical protein FWD57_04350, partial [Polyangiaceae bacterium]|nr:hypothetical protein [Polyangiaceae bacterium]